MERLLLNLPQTLSVTTKGATISTTVCDGVRYWLDTNDATAEVICDPATPEQCSIQFHSVWNMVQFKLHFGIDKHPKHGGLALKFVRKSKAEFVDDRKYRIEMMQSGHPDLYFRLKKQHGWWQLACPKLARAGYVYWTSWKQMGFTMRTMKHRFNLEELIELAHELRQIYVDAPIMMRTAKDEIIDVTDLDAVMITLMH